MTDRRFPRRVFGHGTEPDPRFTLANERTFLAWLRTGLALMAGGVALEALSLDMHPGFRLAAAIVLIVAGTAVPISAWIGWARNERALREGRPLPTTAAAAVLAVVAVIVGVLVIAGIVVR